MTDVVLKLEKVALLMDKEEVEREKQRQRLLAEQRRREEERLQLQGEAALIRLQQFQRETQQQQHSQTTLNGDNVQASALDKLRRMNGDMQNLSVKDTNGAYLNDLKRSFPSRGEGSSLEPDRRTLSRESSRRSLEDRPRRRGSNDAAPTLLRESSRRSQEGRPKRRGSNDSASSDRMRRRESNESWNDNAEHPRRRTSNGGKAERSKSGDHALPPPLTPEDALTPPPSYSSIMDQQKLHQPQSKPLSVLEQAAAHAAAGGAVRPPHSSLRVSSAAPAGPLYANRELEKKRRAAIEKKEKVPMYIQKQKARAEYEQLRASERIQVFGIPTHQGRIRSSTNGCAVISPLVVSRHLNSPIAVEDQDIVNVIDSECGPLLREIRGKLSLEGDALIIPSDVHDHLVDKKVLSQKSFVGATGGNLMDRKHLAEFLRLLDSGEKNSHSQKRTGAALFFREHVVSIVKLRGGNGKWYYDLIDSLPGASDGKGRPQATRTRCRDLMAFEALIRYYASSKFSDSNCNYIDNNDWDDCMADFDPRVFQAFVWGDI
jgi:hypothetical protein